MVLRHNPKFYKWVLICSFLILCTLIGFLVFNTYQYKDKNFELVQRKTVERAYSQYVMNDKLFPGGDGLFKTYLAPELPALLDIVLNEPEQGAAKSRAIVNSFFDGLRKHQTMDSVFHEILINHSLDTALNYKLVFDRLDLLLPNGRDWYTFFQYEPSDVEAEIAGTLQKWNANSKILQLSVSESSAVNYRFTYSIYLDYQNRWLWILKDMLPVYLFSVLSVLLIVTINYLTYRNWIGQRKEAELKTDFLNHIRHEFNTPITTILVCAKSLKEQREILGTAEIESFGNVIERQAGRLKLYFKQVLESVTLTTQKPELKLEDISLLTKELLKDISLRHSGKIGINYLPIDGGKRVWVDPSYYFSILDNLVSNALKFNQSPEPTVSFFLEEHSSGLILNVKDNGIGIRENELKNVFEKFYRSKSGGNRPGLGLGLYYVKTLVDLLGWQLEVESKIASGTTFRLIILNA